MEVEKTRSKGGFFHLFDWNGKSRKKLFSSNAESSEESKLVKQVEDFGRVRHPLIDLDESKASLNRKGSSDFSSASSVTSDEGYGTRAPGVVARLMGLDSLPTSNVLESCSTPYLGSRSQRTAHYETNPNFWNGNNSMEHSNMPYKLDVFSSNSFESRFHKVQGRPIERFQTESLPPKSAKSIPITHHKLLSPIKSPGFILRNADYVMEAAAKIIEASPQAANKIRVSSLRSPSVPLKIRDLKEKMEAADKTFRSQRPGEPSSSKSVKSHPSDKSQGRSDYTSAFRPSRDSEKRISPSSGRDRKSVSLAVQAKVNVQRREGSVGSVSSGSRSSLNQKEKNDVKAKQFSRSQTDMQRTSEKGVSANRPNNVLRQNNQKQNCAPKKDCSASKVAVSNQQGRKAKSMNGTGSTGLNRTVNKVAVNSETRKTVLVATDTKKELSLSRRKNLPGKKQPENGDLHSEGIVSGSSSINKDRRSIKCNVAINGHKNWGAENIKTGMDVISFTFSSPIKGSMPGPYLSGQDTEKKNSFVTGSSADNDQTCLRSSAFASAGFNIIDDDDLSVLVEQKLQELACKIESSNCNVIRENSSVGPAAAFSLQDSVAMPSMELERMLQLNPDKDISYIADGSDCSLTDNLGLDGKKKWQFEALKECDDSSNYSETITEFDQLPSSSVSLDSSRSCSDSRNEIKRSSLALDQATSSWVSSVETQVDGGTELSDTASSISLGYIDEKHITRAFNPIDPMEPTDWELDYIKLMLINADLMFVEFAMGYTNEVIVPDVFNQLESDNAKERNGEDYSKLCRKLLFDCVSECLGLRCEQLFVGTCKGWARCAMLSRRKGLLAGELYKEISSWKSMGDMMVDELVDRDMSSQYGRWLDFNAEAFEEGIGIEKIILTSLVDELVTDFLLV
ncbi:hypothetical protein SLEP1_g40620 [Rubroshorea leprosula]|uniref:DUF4378 domain-containing protein n=1 Tax=Rubroshorea leprosula TaxID=152421 RepID=A0AAV5L4F5_9ROSI|nr:hypothetical protein SLEP1_g40620 [Rubroshorea leprosula]